MITPEIQRVNRTAGNACITCQGLFSKWELKQVQVNWLVWAEHLALSNHEDQGVANSTGCASDGDLNWLLQSLCLEKAAFSNSILLMAVRLKQGSVCWFVGIEFQR
jgi:hypothetical protein